MEVHPAGARPPGWRRQALWALVALLGFAGMIARLRRFPRPRFEPVATYAGGSLGFGRVILARPGAPSGQNLGWAAVCRGAEVLSRPGDRSLTLVEGNDDFVRVRVERGSGAGRMATIHGENCRVEWSPGPSP